MVVVLSIRSLCTLHAQKKEKELIINAPWYVSHFNILDTKGVENCVSAFYHSRHGNWLSIKYLFFTCVCTHLTTIYTTKVNIKLMVTKLGEGEKRTHFDIITSCKKDKFLTIWAEHTSAVMYLSVKYIMYGIQTHFVWSDFWCQK